MAKKAKPEELDDKDLEDVDGGLLLPAVQAARESARRNTSDTLSYQQDAIATESFDSDGKDTGAIKYPDVTFTFSAAD